MKQVSPFSSDPKFEERSSVCCLKKEAGTAISDDGGEINLGVRALKRFIEDLSTETKYFDLRFVLPLSNLCGCVFSKAGFLLNDRRRGTMPRTFL